MSPGRRRHMPEARGSHVAASELSTSTPGQGGFLGLSAGDRGRRSRSGVPRAIGRTDRAGGADYPGSALPGLTAKSGASGAGP